MDRRERFDDPVEAVRAATDGRMSEIWTALPGIVEAFDSVAMTVSVQPAVLGSLSHPDGSQTPVRMPLLVDVPVVFPCGGGFTLTFPIRAGDECLVVFASRCIDGWWQNGGVQEPMESRQFDLSDGFAVLGPFSQTRVLPGVHTQDVQLRTDDGQAFVAIKPDLTILAQNPTAKITLSPDGEIDAEADTRISLRAPLVAIAANALTMSDLEGGSIAATITGDIIQTGSITSTEDHVAGTISLMNHVHDGVDSGPDDTGGPK